MSLTWLTGSPALQEPWELPHSAVVSIGTDKLTASVRLIVDWEERDAVMENILANSLPWPYYASDTALRAVGGAINSFSGEASIEDAAYAPGGNKFSLAELSVNFESASAEEGEDGEVIFSESIEPTAEYLSIPTDKLHWASVTGEKVKEPPGLLLPGFDYKVTYYNVDETSIPADFLTLTGKCNRAAVPSKLGTLAAETLLYNPPSMNRSVSFGSSNRWTLSMRLTYKPTTWNKFYRTETNAFEFMYHSDSGVLKPVVPASFAAILPSGM